MELHHVDVEKLKETANNDPEFVVAARFWDATVKFVVGEGKYMVRIEDGKIASVDPNPGLMEDWDYDFVVSAAEEEWAKLLEPIPRPFYQALLPATLLHGFDYGGDFLTFCAYYRALSRMVEIMRLCRPAGA
jgi:hypothetical protein